MQPLHRVLCLLAVDRHGHLFGRVEAFDLPEQLGLPLLQQRSVELEGLVDLVLGAFHVRVEPLRGRLKVLEVSPDLLCLAPSLLGQVSDGVQLQVIVVLLLARGQQSSHAVALKGVVVIGRGRGRTGRGGCGGSSDAQSSEDAGGRRGWVAQVQPSQRRRSQP